MATLMKSCIVLGHAVQNPMFSVEWMNERTNERVLNHASISDYLSLSKT